VPSHSPSPTPTPTHHPITIIDNNFPLENWHIFIPQVWETWIFQAQFSNQSEKVTKVLPIDESSWWWCHFNILRKEVIMWDRGHRCFVFDDVHDQFYCLQSRLGGMLQLQRQMSATYSRSIMIFNIGINKLKVIRECGVINWTDTSSDIHPSLSCENVFKKYKICKICPHLPYKLQWPNDFELEHRN
jgi:hypothetical protein